VALPYSLSSFAITEFAYGNKDGVYDECALFRREGRRDLRRPRDRPALFSYTVTFFSRVLASAIAKR
jgi:hypothetical protein